MPQYSTRKELKFIDNGTVDWNPVKQNFENCFNDIKINAEEVTALAQRQTWTVTKFFDEEGIHEIMAAGKHLNCRVINAFCTLGDNQEEDVQIKYLNDQFTFLAAEMSGTSRAIRVSDILEIAFFDAVEVEQTGNRKIIYNFTFESTQEKET